jgi:subtilase family serine protease
MLPELRSNAPRRPVFFLSAVCLLLSITCISAVSHAQTANLVRTPVNPANRVALTGHHPTWANPQNDVGAVPAGLPMESLTLVLARSPQQEQAYTQFLQDQQNPTSPNYHHWLTPVEIGKRFGASSHDIHAVAAWLQSQGLRVDSISNSRDRINFSGPAAAVATAFGAEMHYFTVSGEKRISITAEPQIPAALGQAIKSISGLYTVKFYPQHKVETVHVPGHNMASDSGTNPFPDGTFCNGSVCQNFIFPSDFATIYNINGVGVNGAGQTIAIVGRSGVCTSDITDFATAAAVTPNLPNVIVPPAGVTPPTPVCTGNASGDQSEATLDVTRSGSIAQGAALDLVISADTATQDGIDIAATFVVDTPPTPAPKIMSISFGLCEQQAGSEGVQAWDNLFKQAAGEGIAVYVSAGDSGAAGCDASFQPPPANQFLSPNSICASSYATCVGGTEFADFSDPSLYWNSTNGTGYESALSYIPEGAWNEPMNGSQFQAAATGGGVSGFIPTPTWQVGTGVPAARTGRYTPDIAFSSSGHDGYFGCLAANNQCPSNGFEVFSGTSAAAPDMAGIAALLNQKEGSDLGTLNANLYALAGVSTNGIFHDVTVSSSGVTNCVVTTPSMCNNSTPATNSLTGGLSGYLVDAGYDEATGLGSINVANLLANWNSLVATSTTLSITPASPVNAGTSVTLTATVKPASGTTTPTGTVTFFNGSTALNTTPATLTNGVASFTSSTLAGATYSITAVFSPATGTDFAGSTSSAVPYNVQDFQITASPTTVTVTAPGMSGSTTLTITPLGGFSQTLTYSCTGLPSEATCTFPTAATGGTMTITTTAASGRLERSPFDRGRKFFYAMLLPGLVGLLVSAGNRKRTWRGVRLLGFVVVLALSVLWMPACGGGSSTPSNPGTPMGTSTVTVTATTGGTGALMHTTTVTLTVQ